MHGCLPFKCFNHGPNNHPKNVKKPIRNVTRRKKKRKWSNVSTLIMARTAFPRTTKTNSQCHMLKKINAELDHAKSTRLHFNLDHHHENLRNPYQIHEHLEKHGLATNKLAKNNTMAKLDWPNSAITLGEGPFGPIRLWPNFFHKFWPIQLWPIHVCPLCSGPMLVSWKQNYTTLDFRVSKCCGRVGSTGLFDAARLVSSSEEMSLHSVDMTLINHPAPQSTSRHLNKIQ